MNRQYNTHRVVSQRTQNECNFTKQRRVRDNKRPVFDVASKAKSSDLDHSLEHEHRREEEVKDLKSKVKFLNITAITSSNFTEVLSWKIHKQRTWKCRKITTWLIFLKKLILESTLCLLFTFNCSYTASPGFNRAFIFVLNQTPYSKAVVSVVVFAECIKLHTEILNSRFSVVHSKQNCSELMKT